MENDYQEPEERATDNTQDAKATVVPPDEDMLTSEPKIDRSHASTASTGPTVQEFKPPPFTGKIEEEPPQGPPNPQDHPFANPGVKDAPPHVKEQGAEFVADKILLGYGKLKKTIAGWIVIVSDKKLDKMEDEGLIDRNIPLPLRTGGSLTAGDYIDQHNEQAEKVIDQYALTPQFYETAKPMLIEELSKRDIALTNLQMLGVTTAMDLFEFGEKIKPLYQQRRDMINAFKEATAAYKAAPRDFQPNYARPQTNTEPPPVTENNQPVHDNTQPESQPGGNIDTAFEDLQSGRAGFMNPGTPLQPLPHEFDHMPATPIAPLRRKRSSGTTTRKKKKSKKKNTLMNAVTPQQN